MADALSCMFHALRNHLSRTLALATLCTLGLALATTPAFADDAITTIDISGKGSNTTVTIDKPGSYRLCGSSSTTWVHVKTGNVTLYLADGLNINPGISANAGKTCPSIKIENTGGTVNIISEANAQAKLSSYLTSPAIQKEGTQTKLVFSTADSEHPGTISATAASGSMSAGIGTNYKLVSNGVTGNIVFKSGKVIARGGTDAAGIGGGSGGSVDGITIEGTATIEAYGSAGGAGIGCGFHGTMRNITIRGGNVTAKGGDNGAGIGCGRDEQGYTHGTITIEGGTVNATGGGFGAGIGGSFRSKVNSIVIKGGTVKAIAGEYACGIGSGGGTTNEHWCKSITISGGNVTAVGGGASSSHAAAIGNECRATGRQTISITGGIVRAYATSDHAHAIGGGGTNGPGSYPHVAVDISGGTIIAKGGSKASTFGSNGNGYNTQKGKYFVATITGGSILFAAGDSVTNLGTFQVDPTDAAHNKVSPTAATMGTLKNKQLDLGKSQAVVKGLSSNYGMNDVTAISLDDEFGNGKKEVLFCPWLPTGTTLVRVDASVQSQSVPYTGSAVSGKTGTLYPACKLTLSPYGTGTDGHALALFGEGVEAIQPAIATGQVVERYTASPNPYSEQVMDAGGKLSPNVTVNGTRLTDAQGNWIYSGGTDGSGSYGSYTLYAQMRPVSYTVHFDANAPAGSSATASGAAPDDIVAKYGKTYKIGEGSTLFIPGYTLSGWNTAADGSGTVFAPGEAASNLSDTDGATVTLYAQWTRKPYTIHFEGGEGATGHMDDALFDIDVAGQLPANRFNKPGYTFAGWAPSASVGGAISDGAWVTNLCAKDVDGNILLDANGSPMGLTLTARWIDNSVAAHDVAVTVGIDNSAAKGFASRLTLVDGGTSFAPFEEKADTSGTTYYALKREGALPAGTYMLMLDGKDTGKTVEVGDDADVVSLNLYSLATSCDNKLAGVDVQPSWSIVAGTDTVYLVGSHVTLAARGTARGYAFDQWTSPDDTVHFAESSSEASNPTTVVVDRALSMYATSRPIDYCIRFDPNADDVTGTMEEQTLAYDTEADLLTCDFARTGYAFAGWSTKPDGSGDTFADSATVKNLMDSEGTLTLFAQWKPITYFVHFDGNLADGPAMQSIEATYGQAFYLPENTFVFHNDGLADSTFIGWNTQRDGSGDTYEDAQQVINLCSEQGTSITLYAQWRDPEPAPTPDPGPEPDPEPTPGTSGGTDQKTPQRPNGTKSKGHSSGLPGTGDGSPLWIAIGALGIAAVSLGTSRMKRSAR